MKRVFLILLCFAILLCGCGQTNGYFPFTESPPIKLNNNENICGVWISYLEFDELLCGKSESEFRAAFSQIADNCVSFGINTLFIQVRSHADAYYNSKLFPTSKHLCGEFNGNINYDALKIMTEICHSKRLKIHAWINPYRAYTQDEMDKLTVENRIKGWYNNRENLIFTDGRYYLNPASDEVINLVLDGVKEVLNYSVDGIHFDDYFYPTTDEEIDKNEFSNSVYDDLSEFRLDCTSRLISSLYATVKEYNKDILFGVSPQGNIENNYNYQFADVKRWCSENGFVDYIAPQIYYGFKNSVAPFSETAKRWEDLITAPNIKLIIGLAAYKVGTDEETGEWSGDDNIISRQIEVSKELQNYGGVIFYRYASLFLNDNQKIQKEIETIKTTIKE